jgi:hypothetical protein
VTTGAARVRTVPLVVVGDKEKMTQKRGSQMIVLLIILLVVWLVLAVVGFAFKGLLWLAIIGLILFVATAIIGFVRRAARRRT